jgi:hypothetical protein
VKLRSQQSRLGRQKAQPSTQQKARAVHDGGGDAVGAADDAQVSRREPQPTLRNPQKFLPNFLLPRCP